VAFASPAFIVEISPTSGAIRLSADTRTLSTATTPCRRRAALDLLRAFTADAPVMASTSAAVISFASHA
jgi:hypothetical protein